MKFPWPLRYTIPGAILLLGVLLSASSFLYDRNMATHELEIVINRHAKFIGNQVSGAVAHLLAENDVAGLRNEISDLGADPILRMALVVDDQQQVLACSRYEFAGLPLSQTPLAAAPARISPHQHAKTIFTGDRRTLLGIFPFLLPPRAGELISSRTGYLLLDYDTEYPKGQISKAFVTRSTVSTVMLALGCLLAWAFFYRVLNNRVARLVKAAQRLAAGESMASPGLRGSDELAQLSATFDEMARRISLTTSGLREANGRMQREIAERKFVEEALRNSERRFRSIWENSLEAMRLTDQKGTVLAVNPAYCAMVNLERDDILQQPFTDAYPPERTGELLAKYQEAFNARQLRHEERRLQLHSGREVDLDVSYSFIDLERDQPLLLAIFRDVTEKKREEEHRLALERKLLDSQKLESLGVLAGGIAHDFNNLLAAILGNANLAQMQLAPSSAAAGYLKNVEKTALRAADLCRQMLAYSGKGRFTMHHLDLNELVNETLELLEVSITKKATLRVELRPSLPPVYADPAQIRQVIMNLVINASEAIGESSGMIRIRTGSLEADTTYLQKAHAAPELPSGEFAFVEVTDTGCGMSPETQARIFEPFFTTKFTGRGLGLAAVVGIVRGHNGALKITSEVGAGSTFKFLLPVAASAPQPKQTPGANASGPWKGEGAVLVVDDDPTVRAVTARMVEGCGFSVLQAVDGLHGVEVFSQRQNEVRAVVLDMTMPKLNGLEALREMRRIRPDVKVLLVSGFCERVNSADSDRPAPDAFLQKPFKREELNGKLRSILTRPNNSSLSSSSRIQDTAKVEASAALVTSP